MNFDPKNEIQKKVLVYSISLIIGISFYLLLSRLDGLLAFVKAVFSLLLPFLLGFGIAFVLNSPILWLDKKLQGLPFKEKTRRYISIGTVFVLFIFILVFTLWILVPALIDSVNIFAENISSYSGTIESFLVEFASRFNIDYVQVETFISSLNLLSQFSAFLQNSVGKLFSYSYSVISMMLKLIIGIAAAFYLTLDKKRLVRIVKMIMYAALSEKQAEFIIQYGKGAKVIFEQYIVGNLLDSTIVGAVCYLFCLLLSFPYAPMIGLFVGVTNLIPVFGPFLGAIPVIIILLVIQPWYAVIFAVFILVLQQVDGNILKPIILGDKLGLSGFWILFSVTIGGSLFGILGMFLGVPVFALIYEGVKKITEEVLRRKKIRVPTGQEES